MKKKLILVFCLVITMCKLYSQQPDYKVVFDLSTRDSVSHQALTRELQLIKENNPAARMHVVIYGQGINLVLNKSRDAETIRKLATDKNISFVVCAFTLKRFGIQETELVQGVTTVPDGIYEIIRRQKEGWGYIKVAH